MTLKSHAWAYIQRKTWPQKIHAPQCSLQHCLFTMAKTWKHPKVPQQMTILFLVIGNTCIHR